MSLESAQASGPDRSAWLWGALMPHPPIMVPEVGRGREMEAAQTLAGARDLTERLSALPGRGRPDVVLILSPHQPYTPGALFMNNAPVLQGGLAHFGAPEIRFTLELSESIDELAAELERAGLPVVQSPAPDLSPDHGSTVPLYFLAPLLTPRPKFIVASPMGLTPPQAFDLGQILAGFRPKKGKGKWALLASGDLSHRLRPEAPNGFDPQGPLLDKDITDSLAAGSPEKLLRNWPSDRLRAAGECGFRSVLTLMGLAGTSLEVLSYEGPFGVGYSNALWVNSR